ncbi:MAG: RNA polymerase sigma factor [Terracidiphilus sp.]
MNSSEGVPVAACTATLPLTGLSKLFGEHHRRVLTAAYRITGSMADAEDVTQAVFLRLASADGPVTNASSYLYRAAINGALDVLRQRKAAQTEPLEYAAHVAAAGPGSSPETAASSRQLGALLRIAIGELPPRAAEMFILRYVEEHGNREIAALMGTSQSVVAVTLFNARSRLKKRLSEFERGIR